MKILQSHLISFGYRQSTSFTKEQIKLIETQLNIKLVDKISGIKANIKMLSDSNFISVYNIVITKRGTNDIVYMIADLFDNNYVVCEHSITADELKRRLKKLK